LRRSRRWRKRTPVSSIRRRRCGGWGAVPVPLPEPAEEATGIGDGGGITFVEEEPVRFMQRTLAGSSSPRGVVIQQFSLNGCDICFSWFIVSDERDEGIIFKEFFINGLCAGMGSEQLPGMPGGRESPPSFSSSMVGTSALTRLAPGVCFAPGSPPPCSGKFPHFFAYRSFFRWPGFPPSIREGCFDERLFTFPWSSPSSSRRSS